MKFEVADRGQGPSWWLHDKGEVLAWPGHYFVTLDFAAREAAAFKAAAASATFEITPCPGGWQWMAVQPINYLMACSPGAFARPAEARRAGKVIKHKARHAAGP